MEFVFKFYKLVKFYLTSEYLSELNMFIHVLKISFACGSISLSAAVINLYKNCNNSTFVALSYGKKGF